MNAYWINLIIRDNLIINMNKYGELKKGGDVFILCL
jgi:hypothetical protein